MRSITAQSLVGLSLSILLSSCGDSSTSPAAAPQATKGIAIASPNGGERFQVGGSLQVRWSIDASQNSSTSTVKVLLSCETGGTGLLSLDHSIGAGRGDTTFALTDSLPNRQNSAKIPTPTGTGCKIRLQDYSQTDVYDTSDASFTVTPR